MRAFSDSPRFRAACLSIAAAITLGGCASPPPSASPPAAAHSAAPMTKDDVRTLFARMAADRAAMERLVATRFPQLTGRKRELMVDQSVSMFASPAFADRVYEQIAPKLQNRGPMAPGAQAGFQAELRDQAAALGQRIVLKGITRLGPDDQERFARHAVALHRSVDAATCRALIDGKLSATRMQQIELDHGASLDDAAFEQSMAMNRRAMQAELAASPPVPQLTPEQANAAQVAWGRAILARGKAPAAGARFDRVRADRTKASDADVCWVTLQYLEAMFDLRGKERIWQLQSYMLDTASE